MMDLRDQLAESYETHPAFACPTKPWPLDGQALGDFAELFERARSADVLTVARARDLASECRRALDAVFASLASQTADDHEQLFLDELRHECTSRMFSEFAFFATRESTGASRIAPACAPLLDGLATQGCIIGKLSAPATEAIVEVTAGIAGQLRDRANEGRSDRASLSVNAGAAIDSTRQILNAEFMRAGALAAGGAFWRTPLAVTDLALELSVPQATWWRSTIHATTRPPLTRYAHLDESTSELKAIIYLSDVGAQNGPTSSYPGVYQALRLNPLQELIGRVIANVGSRTNSPLRDYYGRPPISSMSAASFRAGTRVERARRHFMRLPPPLRFNTHLGWDVWPGSTIERSLAGAERPILGPPGTFTIFDGAHVLHRGGLVEGAPRLALQAVLADPHCDIAQWPEASRDHTSVADAASQ